MDILIQPQKLHGTINAIPSKSQAHRFLICAAFADGPTQLVCHATNQDIEATADCLRSLGAQISRTDYGYEICPVSVIPESATLCCKESGSTLRFMLPIVGALGVDAVFHLEGRLAQRPLSPLWEEMERHGCWLTRPGTNTIRCAGKMDPGQYTIDGSISSQYITGLLFAIALMQQGSQLQITGKLESAPYVTMTQDALTQFGVATDSLCVKGYHPLRSPGKLCVEGDWSNGAFFLAANKLGSSVNVAGLTAESAQGDRAVVELLERLDQNCTIDAKDIPDLVPVLAVVAAANKGAVFANIRRLRLKESDRVATVMDMLQQLGISAEANDNQLTIHPGIFTGGTVDAAGDHRIAMSAAVAATVATGPVRILGAQCVSKSYPAFWDEYRKLGGIYEQYIR